MHRDQQGKSFRPLPTRAPDSLSCRGWSETVFFLAAAPRRLWLRLYSSCQSFLFSLRPPFLSVPFFSTRRNRTKCSLGARLDAHGTAPATLGTTNLLPLSADHLEQGIVSSSCMKRASVLLLDVETGSSWHAVLGKVIVNAIKLRKYVPSTAAREPS